MMSDNVVEFRKRTTEDEQTPWAWLRECADVLERENNGTKTQVILALSIYEAHSNEKAHQRLWRYAGTLIETVGMLTIAVRDLISDSTND